jgi:ribonuclease HII
MFPMPRNRSGAHRPSDPAATIANPREREVPASPRKPDGSGMPQPTLHLEARLAEQGHDLIVGFDEVGRGALAGPVMVGAAAIWARDLPDMGIPDGVADSKLLTARKREAMFDGLRRWCAADAVGQASNTEIDEWGISYALGIAALRALNDVERQLGDELADGSSVGAILDGPNDYITKVRDTFDAPHPRVPAQVVTAVRADQHCASVSAASVIAKVTRDRLMVSIAQGNPLYQPYGWAHNKGYGSAQHRAAIARLGPTSLHRVTWHLI